MYIYVFSDVCLQMVRDLKEAAEISMGTEITMMDIISIKALADQVWTRCANGSRVHNDPLSPLLV